MNEWKELQIDNLPLDILTGNYEFGFVDPIYGGMERAGYQDNMTVLMRVFKKTDKYYYRYRKPEPKPTHEEIAKNYYEGEAGPFYLNEVSESISIALCNVDDAIESEIKKAFIAGRESADMPPEAT